eukprot:1146939-Pelagomonas_calceolata.AAC.9
MQTHTCTRYAHTFPTHLALALFTLKLILESLQTLQGGLLHVRVAVYLSQAMLALLLCGGNMSNGSVSYIGYVRMFATVKLNWQRCCTAAILVLAMVLYSGCCPMIAVQRSTGSGLALAQQRLPVLALPATPADSRSLALHASTLIPHLPAFSFVQHVCTLLSCGKFSYASSTMPSHSQIALKHITHHPLTITP